MVRIVWKHGGSHVLLAGSFTGWKAYPMKWQHTDQGHHQWYIDVNLPQGSYEYKFIVDGNWVLDNALPIVGKPPHLHHTLNVTAADVKTQQAKEVHPPVGKSITAKPARFTNEVVSCEKSEEVLSALQQGTKVKLGVSLQHVYLSYSGLSEEHLFRFLEALKDNKTLQILNLSHNNLSENFTKTLIHVLNSTAIKEIHLWSCSITDTGATLLAHILPKNQHLTGLYLRGNKITKEGSQALASAVHRHPHISVVDLWDNPLGEDGFLAWAKVVKESNLKELHLYTGTSEGQFHIGKQTAKEWLSALEKPTKYLQDLHIFLNDRAPSFKTTKELLTEFQNK